MAIEEGTLKVHYDGEGALLKKHRMKAKSVSKSILAIETIYIEAFNESNRVLRSKYNTDVFVEGGFQDGSLWWVLKIFGKEEESQKRFEHKSGFSTISSAINKAIEVLKIMPFEKSEIVIRETTNGYKVDIDGKHVLLDEVECAILTNEKIRTALSDLAKPLSEEGVDTLTIENYTNPANSIKLTNSDKDNLIISRKHKYIVDEGRTEGIFFVENLSYNPKSKWKLISHDDPNMTLSATIVDPTFLKRVSENTEKFSKDDLLEVVVNWYKEKSKLTGNITTINTIVEVRNHVPYEDRQRKLL